MSEDVHKSKLDKDNDRQEGNLSYKSVARPRMRRKLRGHPESEAFRWDETKLWKLRSENIIMGTKVLNSLQEKRTRGNSN